MGLVGHTLDIDRLLWVPGAKKIFIPSASQVRFFSSSMIVEIEMNRIASKLRLLFERDNTFYTTITGKRGIITNIEEP